MLQEAQEMLQALPDELIKSRLYDLIKMLTSIQHNVRVLEEELARRTELVKNAQPSNQQPQERVEEQFKAAEGEVV